MDGAIPDCARSQQRSEEEQAHLAAGFADVPPLAGVVNDVEYLALAEGDLARVLSRCELATMANAYARANVLGEFDSRSSQRTSLLAV